MPGGGGLKRPRSRLGCSGIEEEDYVNVQSARIYSNKGASNLNKLLTYLLHGAESFLRS